MFLGDTICNYLFIMFVVHLKSKTIGMNYCEYYKNENKMFSNCFNVIDLNYNEIKIILSTKIIA